MKRTLLYGSVLATALIIAAVVYILRPPAEASAPIEATPVAVSIETTSSEAAESPVPTPSPDEAPEDNAAEPMPDPSPVIYALSQEESEARFSIDELLRNVPTTAVGVTSQVAAELALDFETPANSLVGPITVNARTLQTDNGNRDRIIRNQILDTDEFEFVVFTPNTITGLPESFNPGETISFQISGDLTIRDVTAPAVFDVTAAVDEAGRLSGGANSTVLHSDYGLIIPSVQGVADVSDEVILEIDFVAYPN